MALKTADAHTFTFFNRTRWCWKTANLKCDDKTKDKKRPLALSLHKIILYSSKLRMQFPFSYSPQHCTHAVPVKMCLNQITVINIYIYIYSSWFLLFRLYVTTMQPKIVDKWPLKKKYNSARKQACTIGVLKLVVMMTLTINHTEKRKGIHF